MVEVKPLRASAGDVAAQVIDWRCKRQRPSICGSGRKAKTRSADPLLIQKARRYGVRQLMRASGASQHSVERFLNGEGVHPATRASLEKAIAQLEQQARTIKCD